MPQEGQGNPVVAFNKHIDCALSNLLLTLLNHKKYGTTNIRHVEIIPNTLDEILLLINFLFN